MRKAIYAGTFDPPHQGHLDLIERGHRVVDELVVAVAINRDKRGVIPAGDRVQLLKRCVSALPGVRVVHYSGLVVELLRAEGATLLLRGIRSGTELDQERALAMSNRQLSPTRIETILLLADPSLAHISSSRIREIASFGGDVRSFLPPSIADELATRLEVELRSTTP